ncbi:MAG TPA: arginine--tRNA ligase [Dehalococcoidia bacterium]|nr:arginine--tRNA ligase [Dehalococcoidia bacterium]
MIKHDLAGLVRTAAEAAQACGDLASVALPEIRIERPKTLDLGDYSTPVAMELRRTVGGDPLAIAEKIVRHFPSIASIESPSVARPGFINFRLRDSWLTAQVETILEQGQGFGNQSWGEGRSVQVEFVSANPTGPLHVGNGRGAALGSTLATVLEAAGFRVEREYYVNDAGSQIDVFTRTLYARYQQLFGRPAPIPEDGYPGEYMIELAESLRTQYGETMLQPEGEAPPPELGPVGIAGMLRRIRDDLESLRVHYDVWFSESSLYGESQRYQTIMDVLRQRGYVAEKEGAVWFTSTDLGEDKDNVLVRRDGTPTYFASDIAYHYDKFVERKFGRVIDIWGADHQGHVSRLKAAVAAIGADPEQLSILLYQLVMVKGGRLSKRAGNIITLRELVSEVGSDACRFFFLSRSGDSQMEFDLDLAKRRSNDNPVYYVQYAHARIAGILRTAEERGVSPAGGDVQLLRHPTELALIRKMLVLPELVETVAKTLEPHHLPHYASELATAFHAFYTECRVVSEDEALTRARLRLTAAARVALARVLHLMGMSAPERM